MKLFRAITNLDLVNDGIFERTFHALEHKQVVTLRAHLKEDPVRVIWTIDMDKTEEHFISPDLLNNLTVQRHTKGEGGFEIDARKEITTSFDKLTPCDILDLSHLRQN